MRVVVVVVMDVVIRRRILVNQASNLAKLLDVAGDIDRAFLIEAVLLLRLPEQLREERVVHVHHRDHEPLLLRALPHRNRHASPRNAPPPRAAVLEMKTEVMAAAALQISAASHGN